MPAGLAADEPLLGALATARALGFLGPGPVETHLAHADAFLPLLPAVDDAPGGRGLDLGSGGGVPGLVLAWRLPGWRWTLVDAARRRTSFLASAVATLGLGERVAVVRARAEELGRDPAHRQMYDVVTARSFAPPAVTAEVGGAFVGVGGRLLVAGAPDAAAEDDRWDPEVVTLLGLEDRGSTSDPAIRTLVRVQPLDERFPRPTAFRKPLGERFT